MLKTQLSESNGLKVGDRVTLLPYLQIDGNLFPVIKGRITSLTLVDFEDGVVFVKVEMTCERNKNHWKTLHIDARNLEKVAK